ncbi:MAG TPA: alpha/beta hydrolase [Candidatus Saccharimonadales bacterium]|jgi:acetyl esterase/lipase
MSSQSSTIKLGLRFSRLLRSDITNENLAAKRISYDKLAKFFPVAKSVKIRPEKAGGVKAEWIVTPQAKPDKIMLYMHGGGFVFNSTKLHRDLIARIAAASQVTALSLDYSLAPEHPFPKALEETMAAYRWLLREKKINPKHVVLAGDSAGGSLVLSALQTIRNEKLPNPACAVVIAPATDATLQHPQALANQKKDFFIKRTNLDFFIDAYFGQTPRDDPIASPLLGSLRGFPSLLVHASKNELMHNDSMRFVEKAKREGVKVEFYQGENLWHVWHLFARYLPEARQAIQNIGEFIADNLRYT